MTSSKPEGIEEVLPSDRLFPPSWKDAAIRELYNVALGGVPCAICKTVFHGRVGLRSLQADHIQPWSRGGMTTWENMQLLCKTCNITKLNF
jgi:5-methylcytosine-specific restriction endonuclease McrA